MLHSQTTNSFYTTSNSEHIFQNNFEDDEIFNSHYEIRNLNLFSDTDNSDAIQTYNSKEYNLISSQNDSPNFDSLSRNDNDYSFIIDDNIPQIYPLPNYPVTNNSKTFDLNASQTRSERKDVIDSLLEFLKDCKNTNVSIQINKRNIDIHSDNMINKKKLKRKENNEKNIHRNFLKTIGRNIIRFIKNKNNKALINHFLSKYSNNYENFKNWMSSQNLYHKFVTISSFKRYLSKKNEGVKYDKNMLIFREIGKYYLKNESICEIISKKMKPEIMELYLKCSVSLLNGLKNPDNFNSIKYLLPKQND